MFRGKLTLTVISILLALTALMAVSMSTLHLSLSFLLDLGCSLFSCGDFTPHAPQAYLALFCALTFLVSRTFSRDFAPARLLVSFLLVCLGLRYLLWRVLSLAMQDDSTTIYVQVFYLLIELAVFLNSLLFIIITAWPINRSRQADELQVAVDSGLYLPRVDILIPSYNEDGEMLRRSICAAQAIDYPPHLVRVFLLDDSRRDHIERLCSELGCNYVRRPDNTHHKAGNVNHALRFASPSIDADLLVFFDADFMPVTTFLRRTVGFFLDGQVAMVQTPQLFFSPDAPRQNLGVETRSTNEEDLFFQVIQPGRDRFNATMCHGTCFVIRRSILEEIGGLPTDSLCEDWGTSILVQSRGYKIPYLNERLSCGASAVTVANFVKQRLRWAQGTWQMLLTPLSPLRIRGLSFMQRLVHMAGVLHWCMSLCTVATILLPVIFFTTGTGPFRVTIEEAVAYWLPYYAANGLAFAWLTRGYRAFFWSDIYGPLLAVPVFVSFVRFLWKPFGATFQVTQKSGAKGGVAVCWSVLWPILAILSSYAAAALYFAFNQIWLGVDRGSSPLMLALTAYGSVALVLSAMVCVDRPERRQSIRVRLLVPARVSVLVQDQYLPVEIVELAEGGLLSSGLGSVAAAGESAILSLPSLNLENLKVKLGPVRAHGLRALVFEKEELSHDQYRLLVQFLYTDPARWAKPEVSELTGILALLTSLANPTFLKVGGGR